MGNLSQLRTELKETSNNSRGRASGQRERLVCHTCQGFGHKANHCPSKQQNRNAYNRIGNHPRNYGNGNGNNNNGSGGGSSGGGNATGNNNTSNGTSSSNNSNSNTRNASSDSSNKHGKGNRERGGRGRGRGQTAAHVML